MSLMYKDELDELKIQWQNAYEQYKEDAEVLNNRIYHAQSEYDNAISVLNAERNDLRSEIRLLYNFLGGLEGACPGPRITPFDFVRERPANRDSDSIEYNGNEACDIQIKSIEKGIVKNALKYGGVALIGVLRKNLCKIINCDKNVRQEWPPNSHSVFYSIQWIL